MFVCGGGVYIYIYNMYVYYSAMYDIASSVIGIGIFLSFFISLSLYEQDAYQMRRVESFIKN